MDVSEVINFKGYKVTKAHVMREAAKNLPLNALGLPTAFYRADLIPLSASILQVIPRTVQIDQVLTEEGDRADSSQAISAAAKSNSIAIVLDRTVLESAAQNIFYDEGFAQLDSGSPFWEQLPGEPNDAYAAFRVYLNAGAFGPRRLYELIRGKDIHKQVILARQAKRYSNLADLEAEIDADPQVANRVASTGSKPQLEVLEMHVSMVQLQEWYHTYYWSSRTRAHDAQLVSAARDSREVQSVALERQHFVDASKLYSRIVSILDGRDPAFMDSSGQDTFWAQCSPRVVADLLKTTYQMQRLSVGLHPLTPPSIVSPFAEAEKSRKGSNGSVIEGSGDGSSRELDDTERSRRIAGLLAAAQARRAHENRDVSLDKHLANGGGNNV